MAMNPTPPTPDALLTIREQLQILHDEWGRAAALAGHNYFAAGQADAWRQAQKQIGDLIESITVARASGIYLTDAQRALVALIEDRHKTTIHFLSEIQRMIYTTLTLEEPTNAAEKQAPGEGEDRAL